jgi:hypothetical protein
MVQLTFEGERELGEVGMADDVTELALSFEHPGGGPREAHISRLPALDIAAGAPDGLDHRPARPCVQRWRWLIEMT